MSTNVSKSPHDYVAASLKSIPRSGIRDFFDIVSSMKEVLSLGVGEPGFDTPWHIREASIFALEHGATGYTSNLGLLKLRAAISEYIERQFAVQYDPVSEILITVGVSEALDLALRALLNPGDEVIYHEPSYVSYRPIVLLAHGQPVTAKTTREHDFRLNRSQLEPLVTKRTKVLLLNYPNNPTGAVLHPDDVQGIASFAIEHDLIVITDEIYAELTYDGDHVSIASLPGMRDRTIFLHGFSKAWAMTGFRMGFACANPVLTEAMMKIHQYTMLCAPILSQEAALEALKQPEIDVRGMKDAYRRHRNFVHASLEGMGLPGHRPGGAFYVFPYVGHLGMSSYDFAMALLDEEKVAVVPGTAFGASGEGFIRCSYATALEDLKLAMERMARFVGRRQAAAV
jgi:aminotransferase